MKVLFVPITEAQMDELQGLSEQGSLKATAFESNYCFSNMIKYVIFEGITTTFAILRGPKSRLQCNTICNDCFEGMWTWQTR